GIADCRRCNLCSSSELLSVRFNRPNGGRVGTWSAEEIQCNAADALAMPYGWAASLGMEVEMIEVGLARQSDGLVDKCRRIADEARASQCRAGPGSKVKEEIVI